MLGHLEEADKLTKQRPRAMKTWEESSRKKNKVLIQPEKNDIAESRSGRSQQANKQDVEEEEQGNNNHVKRV